MMFNVRQVVVFVMLVLGCVLLHSRIHEDLAINTINDGHGLISVDEAFWTKKSVVLFAVRIDGYDLEYAGWSMKNDKDIVRAAVASHEGKPFEFASRYLKQDKEFVLSILDSGIWVFYFTDESLKNDKQVVIHAISVSGDVCKIVPFIPLSHVNDREVVSKLFGLQCKEALDFVELGRKTMHGF